MNRFDNKVVLITGAARRLGATFAHRFHQQGAKVVVHYNQSEAEALQLVSQLNNVRDRSAMPLCGALGQPDSAQHIVNAAVDYFGQLDVLVNNASTFFATPVDKINSHDVDNLFSSNLFGPLYLCQHAATALQESRGCILNMTDAHVEGALANHAVYASAKAGLTMLTRVLAKDLAPAIRVNAIAPGAILWPDDTGTAAGSSSTTDLQESIIAGIPMQRVGTSDELADAVLFLCSPEATYITGQVLAVDGGRSL